VKKPINLAVACSENRVIARDGITPWRIPEDLEHFHRLTAGQTVVLGRLCYEIWPRVELDGRTPVVITQNRALAKAGVLIAADVAEALAIAQTLPGEIMICGGQRIYEELIDVADRIYLTIVHAEIPGDRFFPEWRHLSWRESERRTSQDVHYRYTFSTLDRIHSQ